MPLLVKLEEMPPESDAMDPTPEMVSPPVWVRVPVLFIVLMLLPAASPSEPLLMTASKVAALANRAPPASIFRVDPTAIEPVTSRSPAFTVVDPV